nr:RNA polymerase sigma factor [Ardenticatena sp.]
MQRRPLSRTRITKAEKTRFRQFIERHFDELYDYAARELRYLEALGVIAPGALQPAEVLNEAVIAAWDMWRSNRGRRRAQVSGRALLYSAVRRALATLARQYQMTSGDLSIEEVLVDPEADQQLWAYWEPDDVTTLEDLIPDEAHEPVEDIALEEIEVEEAEAILNQLPPLQRQAFILHALHGLPLEETARLLNTSIQAVQKAVQDAREHLKQVG